jgi:hypothetical protein
LVDREEARDRAEAIFKKSGDHRTKVTAQYDAEAEAIRAKTARLRSLRLAAQGEDDLQRK